MKDLADIARRYKPHGVKVRWRRKGLYPAYAWFDRKMIYAPRPDTREGLFVYLHECAHFHLKHWHVDIPLARQEYEAEQWAISTMRREGLAVPRSMLAEAKTYVSECIKADGGKIERHVRRFAG